MTSAFVVTLDIPDNEDRTLIAEELKEELFSAGFEVLEVNPWDPPTTSLPQGQFTTLPEEPTTGLF